MLPYSIVLKTDDATPKRVLRAGRTTFEIEQGETLLLDAPPVPQQMDMFTHEIRYDENT